MVTLIPFAPALALRRRSELPPFHRQLQTGRSTQPRRDELTVLPLSDDMSLRNDCRELRTARREITYIFGANLAISSCTHSVTADSHECPSPRAQRLGKEDNQECNRTIPISGLRVHSWKVDLGKRTT